MTSVELTITIIILIGAWFGEKAFKEYLDQKKELARIDADKEQTKLLQKVIDVLDKNTVYSSAKNKPPKTAVEMLEDGEYLAYGNSLKTEKYTNVDADRFPVETEDTVRYKTIEDEFTVKAVKDAEDHIIVRLKHPQLKTFDAISKLPDNMPILEALDKKSPIKLKINIGKDSNGDIIEADIYEVSEDPE